jgi:hypothetical protein
LSSTDLKVSLRPLTVLGNASPIQIFLAVGDQAVFKAVGRSSRRRLGAN